MHTVFGAVDKVAALLGAAGPLHWLTIGSASSPMRLYEVDGRTYIIDVLPSRKGWVTDARIHGHGMLTTGRTDTDVTLTEVTDPAVKLQAVIAFSAQKPTFEFATGEHKHLKGQPLLVATGLAKNGTPDGLASAVPHVAVFEVTPT